MSDNEFFALDELGRFNHCVEAYAFGTVLTPAQLNWARDNILC